MSSRITLLLLLGAPAALSSPAADAALPSPSSVVADGKSAFDSWAAATPVDNCGWTGATFLIGVMEYYKSSAAAGAADAAALAYAKNWAGHYDYQICGGAKLLQKAATTYIIFSFLWLLLIKTHP